MTGEFILIVGAAMAGFAMARAPPDRPARGVGRRRSGAARRRGHARYELAIGADGIHSGIRTGVPPRPVGPVAWRFVAAGVPEGHGWTVWQGRDRTFLAVALGGGYAYCYADCTSRPPFDDWRELFAAFADPVPALAAQGGPWSGASRRHRRAVQARPARTVPAPPAGRR